MATQTKTVSGNITTYTITDAAGNATTIALNNLIGGGRVLAFATPGTGLRNDGQLQLTTLMQQLSTGLTP